MKEIPHTPALNIDDEEITEFQHAMNDLNHDTRKNQMLTSTKQNNYQPLSTPDIIYLAINPVQPDTRLSFHRSGLDHKLMTKLAKGHLYKGYHLDLHGCTIPETANKVSDYINDARQQKIRCVLLIHGKGSLEQLPVLKAFLNTWLPDIQPILAFCSAQNRDGGSGAVYLLLKTIE